MEKIIAACIFLASQTYGLPTPVLISIYEVEGGAVGQEVGPNQNGSYDIGPMQINTVWLPTLAQEWGVNQETARRWLREDPCVNIDTAAWILRSHLDETGDLSQAISHYHSRTPQFGLPYRQRVTSALKRQNLMRLP